MLDTQEDTGFPAKEEKVLDFWKKEAIFQKSLDQREGSTYFSFYDGPPFATGLPHYGHLLAGTIKDAVLRYKTMKGFYVPRRFGWDCHGLPVEQEIEKSFSLSGAPAIESFGIPRFNEECRNIVLRYTQEWQRTVERMGRWVNFEENWKTMDPSFMESVWWVFKEVYKKGLIYEGFKVMPVSAKLGTPLSNFEASENYKEVDDPSVVVKFALVDEEKSYFLAWTTTPWTLISNLALAVGEDFDYVKVVDKEGSSYILSKAALPRWFKEEGYQVAATFKGRELVSKRYHPLFPHFAQKAVEGAFRVISDNSVTLEEGTGVLHMAPAFGESDFFACQKAGISLVCPIDMNGKFTGEIPEYKGYFFKDADRPILQSLKKRGALYYQGTLRHRYPFCWRSDTPLIYRAVTTWFLSVEKIKEDLLKANEKIHWTPEHLKEGRFGKWLEGARDWAISRNRYWGTPIPLWKSEDGEIYVVGSVAELEELTQETVHDLHRHHIDPLEFTHQGKTFRRITEVFDCWFDAGSMPYGQNHYPFENKELTENTFPADFIAEGVDQTRGWFYTLNVLSVALFKMPAFKNAISNGILLAEDGNKMSKRLKNYPEPDLVIQKYGADAIRLYLLHSPAVKAEDLRFSEKGVELILRQILIPFWNAHHFFLTYAKIYEWKYEEKKSPLPEALIDRWIISTLNKLVKEVEEGMDNYDLSRAVEPFVGFVDELTNWYIRRNRRRFWSEKESQDRQEAFETLYHVLITLCKIAAPYIPFISEVIFQNLQSVAPVKKAAKEPLSVHLTDFPSYETDSREIALEEGMGMVQLTVSLGHALRKEHKLKVRQPLPALHIVCLDKKITDFLSSQSHLIEDELNVKRVEFHEKPTEFVQLAIKPNFRILGKKVGKHMREVQLFVSLLDQGQIHQIQEGKSLVVRVGDEEIELQLEDVEISQVAKGGWIAMNAGALTIALDTNLSEELILEGIARELINKINTMRREASLEVSDRIRVYLGATDKVKQALHVHEKYLKEEVLAVEIHYEKYPGSQEWDINGEPCTLFIERC